MSRILIVHEHYQQRGGEDAVVEAESRLFESRGHTVVTYTRNNDDLKERHVFAMIKAGIETVWAEQSAQEIRTVIKKEKPDICHFHNTFPLISPSGYKPCVESGIPVIQTLHNYRFLCPAATFLREGKVCEDCLGRCVAWPGIVHGCYRGSRSATTAISAMLAAHRALGTWREKVDMYIVLSQFARQKFILGGLPAERIVVKPNFIATDPGRRKGIGKYALFVGRLSEEKGLRVLLDAWSQLHNAIPLRIVGGGPLADEIAATVNTFDSSGRTFMGALSPSEVSRVMQGARFLVFPSVWFETFGLSMIEAFACGLPIIASRLGSMAEIVADGVTGLHFTAGDASDLAAKVDWAWSHPQELQEMGLNGRLEYETKYTPERNYQEFVRIWNLLGINARS
jgi:glycosyltransferase involved in cell wall biosynthesis